MKRSMSLGLAATLLAGIFTGCGWQKISAPKASSWISQTTAGKSVTFRIYAAQNGANNDMNFNGYGNGAMTLAVPLGWDVTVNFVNTDNSQSHSAMIVPLADRRLAFIPITDLAFPQASTPYPNQGSGYNIHQSFHFVADKPGTYALACGMPGHAQMGMWDRFIVSKMATRASIHVPPTA